MESKEINKIDSEIAEISGELADGLIELGLEEFIIEANREYGKTLLEESVLEYVKIGRSQQEQQEQQGDEGVLFTIAHIAGQGWIATREIPGLHRIILGRFENAYGAVGIVRQHHPATDSLRVGTPMYPKRLIEEVNLELGTVLKERDLMEYVVEVDGEAQEVVLSNNNRRPKVHLRIGNNSEWEVCISHEYGFDGLGTWKSLDAAIDKAKSELQGGETQ